jgi:Flp pilus assembly protein TadD
MNSPRFLKIDPQKTNLRILPLLLILILTSACATTSKSMQNYSFTSGSVLQDEHEDEKAALEKLSFEELLFRGNQYLKQGNSKLALLHFRMALKKRADSAEAYAGLGETMAGTGSNVSAHAFLDKALFLDNQNRQALLSTGKLYRNERNYKQAEFSFNHALKTYPADPEILTEIAVTYGRMGREDEAEPLLCEVVDLKPGNASAHNNLGFNYLLQGNYPEAIKAFREALRLDPRSSRIQNNLAATYALSSQPEKAFDLFRKTGTKATAYNDLGYIYMILGNKETARESFKKALEFNPRHYVRAKENLSLLEN